MEPKEVVKKILQEKLDSKSREELIDIIVDMSSVYLLAKHSGFLDSLEKSAGNSKTIMGLLPSS